MPHKSKSKRKHRKPHKNKIVRQSNVGQRNINMNVSNRVFVSRQRPNLREVRRALPGSKALKGYSRYGIPELHTHSALLTNNMMAQLNNFRREVEAGQRDLQAQQAAFVDRAQRQNQAAAVAGVAPQPGPPIPPGNMGFGAQQDAEGLAGIRAQEPDPFRGGQQLFRSPQQPHRAGAVAGAQYGDLHARSPYGGRPY